MSRITVIDTAGAGGGAWGAGAGAEAVGAFGAGARFEGEGDVETRSGEEHSPGTRRRIQGLERFLVFPPESEEEEGDGRMWTGDEGGRRKARGSWGC